MRAVHKAGVIHHVWIFPIVNTVLRFVKLQKFVEFISRLLIQEVMWKLVTQGHVQEDHFGISFRQVIIYGVSNAVLRDFSYQ